MEVVLIRILFECQNHQYFLCNNTILRTEKAMCEVKMIEKRSQELRSLLGLRDSLDGLARASRVRWYGHVLRRDNGDILKKDI